MSDAISSFWLWLILIFIIFSRLSSADQNHITVNPGQNVTLPCRAPNNNIIVVEWSRADLGTKNVLVYRYGQFLPNEQHPSFKDRVDLKDRQMKDGDVSLILKNVTINDTGTYECHVKTRAKHRKRANLSGDPIRTIYLSVGQGPTGGLTQDGGKEGGSVGLIVGLSVSAVLLLLLGGVLIFIYKPWRKRHGPDQKHPPDEQQLDSLNLQPCKEKLLTKAVP